MKRIKQLAAVLAVTTMFGASTFAEDRPQNQSGDWRNGARYEGRGNDQRRNLSAQGRITNLQRERDGYRVQLDRGNQWYYVPQSAWRGSRGHNNVDLRIGVSIRLGGGYYDDRGYIYCDDAYVDDGYGYGDRRNDRDYGYRDSYLSGYVQRIDYRRDVLELRDARTGRNVTVDMRNVDRRGRHRRSIDVSDLRRGDYIEIAGDWSRRDVFRADSIDSVDSGRGRGRY